MAGTHARVGFAWCIGAAVVVAGGCSKEGGDAPGAAKTGPAPAASATPTTTGAPPAAAANAPAPAGGPASAPSVAAGEPAVDPLFTLPPSKGPAPYQFQQVTLLRSGPSGDLEMQLTGDGIYRIRDHGRGKSYSGDGRLAEPQIAEWAAAMKDWGSLKDRYVADPPPADADTVTIMYDGKKVVANPADKATPPAFAAAYKRLLDLDAQSRKEAAAAAPADPAAADKGTPPAASPPAAAEPAGRPQGVTPDAGPPATGPAK